MPANGPEQICRLFRQFIRDGDIDSALTLCDREAVFRDAVRRTPDRRGGPETGAGASRARPVRRGTDPDRLGRRPRPGEAAISYLATGRPA